LGKLSLGMPIKNLEDQFSIYQSVLLNSKTSINQLPQQKYYRSDINRDRIRETKAMNHEDIFQLLNLVISLEACLEYGILPLELKKNHLVLGMVNPKDLSAINFVRSLVHSSGYSVDTKLIKPDTHQSVLAEYLKYIDSSASSEKPKTNLDAALTIAELPQPQAINQNQQPANLHERPTLIVDQPEENPGYSSEQVKELSTKLPPEQLWQELYKKLIQGGIGRLYLERLSDYGRIFCSENGVVQFSLEHVSLPTYNAILNQIKVLAKLSPTPLKERKKLAVEKYHQKERLLLRIEMFPSRWGEEATIQVLRGAALNFYEQRQAQKMVEQALSLAVKLEKMVKKMRNHFTSEDLGDISQLLAIQRKINQHLKYFE
jgi:type II secretory ATPase GspE/PulE/Tfp pilus assembly ATPase PilB-like protein